MSFKREKSILILATEFEFEQMNYFAKKLNVPRAKMIRQAISLLETNTRPSDHCVFQTLYQADEDEKNETKTIPNTSQTKQ